MDIQKGNDRVIERETEKEIIRMKDKQKGTKDKENRDTSKKRETRKINGHLERK